MKITIDTKEDSAEELRKIIRLLTELISQKEPQNVGLFDSPSATPQTQETTPSADTSGLMSMFDQPSTPTTPQEPEQKEETPDVELY